MNLIVLFLIVIILVFGIPIGLSYLIFRWIKNKGYDKRLRFLALIPILIMGFIIYSAIYPSSDYYKTDFKEVTKMEFPDSGKIKYKRASFPDQFGDYHSSFLAEFEENDLENLRQQLKKNGFKEKENNMSTSVLDYIERKKGEKQYTQQFIMDYDVGKHYFVGFLDDNKSVIITRVSW